eukprot:447311_1
MHPHSMYISQTQADQLLNIDNSMDYLSLSSFSLHQGISMKSKLCDVSIDTNCLHPHVQRFPSHDVKHSSSKHMDTLELSIDSTYDFEESSMSGFVDVAYSKTPTPENTPHVSTEYMDRKTEQRTETSVLPSTKMYHLSIDKSVNISQSSSKLIDFQSVEIEDASAQTISYNKHTASFANTESIVITQAIARLSDFDGDCVAYNIWITCHNSDAICFNRLFVELLNIWKKETNCDRLPTKHELQSIFIQFGGKSMDKTKYFQFFLWFKKSCVLVNEVKHLWDQFQLNMFMNRADAEAILNDMCCGVFILRLSTAIRSNALVLSYVDSDMKHNTTTRIKHIILRRQSPFKYVVDCGDYNKSTTHLAQLIRSFVKLKYIYCEHNKIYPKHIIF